MKVGFIGLGKLGLPVALAINSKGHEVMGYDVNPAVKEYLEKKSVPFKEKDLQLLLDNNSVVIAEDVSQVVEWADIIFTAPQTPHDPKFEGSTRIPEERKDFDYSFLKDVVQQVAHAAQKQEKKITLVVISTCLPGTYNREIKPLLNDYVNYVYNPFFIAMGTVLYDFFNPEFVLIGCDKDADINTVRDLYATIHRADKLIVDITTAEAIKVSYNTFITTKTVLANLWGEIAHKTGANVDGITTAWEMATDRLMSPRYLTAGMGDGGGCHPRDNIALSYIANKIGLSFNYFDALMKAREEHAAWLADVIVKTSAKEALPIIMLGRSFKPETNIETGSPAVLVSNILEERQVPHIHLEDYLSNEPALYFIGTQHKRYNDYNFEPGSVIIDPFGYIEDQEGVEIIRIGRP